MAEGRGRPGRGWQSVKEALQRDGFKAFTWAVAIIFACGVTYAKLASIEEKQERQLVVVNGTVDALQQVTNLLGKIETRLDEKSESFKSDHARYDREIERLQDRVDAIQSRVASGGM